MKDYLLGNERCPPYQSFTETLRSLYPDIKINKLIVLTVFHCYSEHADRRIS